MWDYGLGLLDLTPMLIVQLQTDFLTCSSWSIGYVVNQGLLVRVEAMDHLGILIHAVIILTRCHIKQSVLGCLLGRLLVVVGRNLDRLRHRLRLLPIRLHPVYKHKQRRGKFLYSQSFDPLCTYFLSGKSVCQ